VDLWFLFLDSVQSLQDVSVESPALKPFQKKCAHNKEDSLETADIAKEVQYVVSLSVDLDLIETADD
jgi:hypothetical protein